MPTDYYQQLKAKADGHFERLQQRHATHLQCRRGCSGCCRVHLSVCAVEAEAVAIALEALPAAVRSQVAEHSRRPGRPECPMLIEGACAIYADRPVICRTQGAPLDLGGGERDVCPLNFIELPLAEVDAPSLLNLETLNTLLAAVNLDFCRTHELDPAARYPLAALGADWEGSC